jgi:DNA polymerase-3 subunit alpha
MGIEITPPDINESFASFTVITSGTKENKIAQEGEEIKTIRFGLNAIKNVGFHIVEEIIKERKENGRYSDIFDLLERIVDKDLNKKSLESLIKCGAFDQFMERELLLGSLDTLLDFNKESSKNKNSSQLSLFSSSEQMQNINRPRLDKRRTISDAEKLQWEKELLGLYISEHPFSLYRKKLEASIIPLNNLKAHVNNDIVTAGVVSSIKKIITKKNENMLFVKIEDGLSFVEILVFPKVLKDTLDYWQDGKTVLLSANVSDKDGEAKLLVNKALLLDEEVLAGDFKKIIEEFRNVKSRKAFNPNGNGFSGGGGYYKSAVPVNNSGPKSLGIELKSKLSLDVIEKIKSILQNYPGSSSVYLKINLPEGQKLIKSELQVENSIALKNELKSELGEQIDIV